MIMTQVICTQHNYTEVKMHFMRFDVITKEICLILIHPTCRLCAR